MIALNNIILQAGARLYGGAYARAVEALTELGIKPVVETKTLKRVFRAYDEKQIEKIMPKLRSMLKPVERPARAKREAPADDQPLLTVGEIKARLGIDEHSSNVRKYLDRNGVKPCSHMGNLAFYVADDIEKALPAMREYFKTPPDKRKENNFAKFSSMRRAEARASAVKKCRAEVGKPRAAEEAPAGVDFARDVLTVIDKRLTAIEDLVARMAAQPIINLPKKSVDDLRTLVHSFSTDSATEPSPEVIAAGNTEKLTGVSR